MLMSGANDITEDSGRAEDKSTGEAENNVRVAAPAATRLLAGVYILAEKYQINDLLALCLKNSIPLIDLTADPETFLEIAAQIYQGSPASDKVFGPYFRDYCPAMLMGFGKAIKNGYRVVNGGGVGLAIDIFQAHREFYRIQGILELDTRSSWMDPVDATDPARVSEIIDTSI